MTRKRIEATVARVVARDFAPERCPRTIDMFGSSWADGMKVLSIRQPWAWLIVNGIKDIENQTWSTNYRGRFLVHSAREVATWTAEQDRQLNEQYGIALPAPVKDLERGGIVGIAELVDCVDASDSAWFVGPHGFVLRNAQPTPFIPLLGKLGFFNAPSELPWLAGGSVQDPRQSEGTERRRESV